MLFEWNGHRVYNDALKSLEIKKIMLKLLKVSMKRNSFVAYFIVYLSKLKIPQFEVLSIKIEDFTSV